MSIPTPQDIEIKAVIAGVSITSACKDAAGAMSATSFFRWKRGSSNPGIERVRALVAYLDRRIAEKGAPARY